MRTVAVFVTIFALDLLIFRCFRTNQWSLAIPHRLNVLSGFAVGQLSLMGVWLAMRRRHDVASALVPLAGLMAASYLRLQVDFFPDFSFLDYLGRNALQALFSLILLWPLVRTPVWRWYSRDRNPRQLGYSIGNILVWMSCVAVLAALLGRATWQNGKPLAVMQWMGLVAPGMLAVAIVIAHYLPLHSWLRLAIHIALGILAGHLLAVVGNRPFLAEVLRYEFCAQAIVVALGVEFASFALRSTDEDTAAVPDVTLEGQ